MENRNFARHRQMLIALLTLVAVALIAATAWYYTRQRTAIEATTTEGLDVIARLKVRQISNWRRERLGDGHVLQSTPIMRIAGRVLSSTVIDPVDRADLLDTMRRLERQFLYTGVALVDRNGVIRLASNVTPPDPLRIRELGKRAAQSNDVSLQDLYWDAKLSRPLMALSVPVQRLGAFILTIDPEEFLYPAIRLWPVPSATAETELIRFEGDKAVWLSNTRFASHTALRYWRYTKDIGYAQHSDTGSNFVARTVDYRGVPVLGILRPIPESPWYLIAKIDISEVDAPVSRVGWEMAAIIALIALANAAGAGFIWRDCQMRIHRDREEWLRHVSNETPAYLWMTGADGENTFINRLLAEFIGTNRESVGKDWKTYLHPEDADRVFDKFFGCVAARAEYIDQHRYRRFDGEYRWVSSTGRPRFSSKGKFLGYAGSLFDITERKAAEDRARENAELVEGQNRVLESIAQNAPLSKTLDVLVRVIEALSPEMLGSVLLLDFDGIHLRHGAAPNLPESYTRAIDGEPIGPMAGSCGTAVFRREAVIVEDIATDPLWENYRDFALSHNLRACWSTPIFEEKGANGRDVLGTFALYFRSPRRPTYRHRELIEMATQTAAIAIVRARETEALRISEERLRLATTCGEVGVWEWQIDTGRLILSDNLRALFDWPKEDVDLTLNKILDAIHPEDRDWVDAALQTAVAKHEDYDVEFRIGLQDGSLRWVAAHGRAQYAIDGTASRVLGVTRDITPQKQAEEEIARREAQLVEAQHIAHLGSYEWDIRTNKVYRSIELFRIFGLPQEEFEPSYEGYLKRVHPEDRESTREVIEGALRECKPFDHEERIVCSDGSVRVLRSQGHFICDEEGRPHKLVGTCQDITDRKHAERQLQAANAALAQELKERANAEREIQALNARLIKAQEEERSRIARELHDDLSQQIAALSVAVSNLKGEIPSELVDVRSHSERIREKLTHLGEGVRRLSHELHPAILRYSGLDAAMNAYCSEFAALAGIQIGFRAEGSFEDVAPGVALCAYRITQEALQNVVKHAQTDHADVTLTCSGEAVKLVISDNGIGIDQNAAETFKGLGLTSIKERVRLVNGAVDIQSSAGRGTTLTAILPVSRESTPSTSQSSSRATE